MGTTIANVTQSYSDVTAGGNNGPLNSVSPSLTIQPDGHPIADQEPNSGEQLIPDLTDDTQVKAP